MSRVVHLMRDPFDNVVARWHFVLRQDKPRQHLWAPYIADGSSELPPDLAKVWQRFAVTEIKNWVHWHCLAMKSYEGLPIQIASYEHLLDDPVAGFADLFEFVGVTQSRRGVLAGVLSQM